MASRPVRPAVAPRPRPETEDRAPGEAREFDIPNLPLIPEPAPGEEQGIAGGPVHLLPSEFSWADRDGEDNLNVATPGDAVRAPVVQAPRPAPRGVPPEHPAEADKRFHTIARDFPDHPEQTGAKRMRAGEFQNDE